MARLFDDASSQYLEAGSAPLTAYPLTMACWFRSDDAAALQVIMQLGLSTDTNERFAYLTARGDQAGDPIHAGVRVTGTFSNAISTTGYSVNTWHHACGRFISTTSRNVRIDGGSEGSNTTSASPGSPDRFRVGANADSTGSSWFVGRTAEVGVWNVDLTNDEVVALANGVSPLRIRRASLVLYCPLLGSSPETDFSGNVNNLTVTGATQADHCRVSLPFGYEHLWVPVGAAAAGGDGTDFPWNSFGYQSPILTPIPVIHL